MFVLEQLIAVVVIKVEIGLGMASTASVRLNLTAVDPYLGLLAASLSVVHSQLLDLVQKQLIQILVASSLLRIMQKGL